MQPDNVVHKDKYPEKKVQTENKVDKYNTLENAERTTSGLAQAGV